MREPNKLLESDAPLAPLESWLGTLIREEIREAMGHDGDQATSTQDSHKPYLTVKEAADFSRLGLSTLRLFIRKQELKALQVGSRVIIKRTDLEGFLESHPIEILPD